MEYIAHRINTIEELQQTPKEYGVENLNEASFGYQVFWPLIQENKKQQ